MTQTEVSWMSIVERAVNDRGPILSICIGNEGDSHLAIVEVNLKGEDQKSFPFVVWTVNLEDGGTHSGDYYKTHKESHIQAIKRGWKIQH